MTKGTYDYKRMGELWREFGAYFDQVHAFYHDAYMGFECFREKVTHDQESLRTRVRGTGLDHDADWDNQQFSYDAKFEKHFGASGFRAGTVGQVKERNTPPKGSNLTFLANACIVTFYDYWEEYLRREYCKAKGYPTPTNEELREHAGFDVWGDIRWLRNSIVHNRGIAIDEMNRCKVIRLFEPGDHVVISPDAMGSIFRVLYAFRNQLHKESLGDEYFPLPVR